MTSEPASTDRHSGLVKLVEITCDLAAQHDLDTILRIVTLGACEAMSCERASLFLYDEDRGELYTRTVTELEIAEIRVPIHLGIAGWVARQAKVLNVPDPYADERFNPEFDRRTGFRTRNVLAVPVFSRRDRRLVGVLQLLNRQGGAFDAFDERVLAAFATHAASALERHTLLEEARLSHELHLAVEVGRRIQTSFLPNCLPRIDGYEVAAWWQPAEIVSGDYYDVLALPDGRIGFVVADVSGHGVGPSLIMASARAMLKVLTRNCAEPVEILTRLSGTLHSDLGEGRFVTFLVTALDPQSHALHYANAGHGPVLLFRRSTGQFDTLDATSLPLGVLEDEQHEPASPRGLDPGDVLVMMTDGAWEVENQVGVRFGIDRVMDCLRQTSHLSANEMLDALQQQILAFHPHRLPPDDVTIMLLKRTETA